MGLFDKKTPCAICGGKVSMFPRKIDGQMVCDECYGHVDLSNEVMKHISLEEFKEYMAFRKENDLLKQRFQITRQVDFGWFDDKFLFDMNNRLLCTDKKLRKPVFEGWQIKSFEIREDQTPLFRGSNEGLIRYTSTVPGRIMAMAPQIEQLRMQIQMRYELQRMIEHQKEENRNSEYYSLPDITVPVPFKSFFVEIHFEHPYWPLFMADMTAPSFSTSNLDINDYLNTYNADVQTLEELASALMELAFPGAPERTVAAEGAAAASNGIFLASGMATDTMDEIQRLKDLMDKGILTEEEFTVKKRQLLGISL